MAKQPVSSPELIVLGKSAQAIYRRFQGWPDSWLAEVWPGLQQDPDSIADPWRTRLQQAGILTAGHPAELALPFDRDLPIDRWCEQLRSAMAPYLADLQEAVRRLAESCGQQGLPAWSETAHSLLVSYLLWGVGGELLLQITGVEAAAVLVTTPAESVAVWPGFVRANQQFGISCPLGGRYSGSTDLRGLLNRSEVSQALATISTDRTVLVSLPVAARVLSRLSFMSGDRLADGSRRIIWPTLTAGDLQRVRVQLLLLAQGLGLLIRSIVPAFVGQQQTNWPACREADLALLVYGLLVRTLLDDWLSSGLLPAMVAPVQGSLL